MQLKQSRFTLILFGIIAAGLVILVVSLVILQHENGKTKALKTEIASLNTEYEARELQVRHLQDDVNALNELNARLALLDKNLIAYEYVPTYLKQIQGTATRTLNLIKSIQPGERKPLDLSNSQFATDDKSTGAAAQGNTGEQAQAAATPEDGAVAKGTDSEDTGPEYQVMSITLDLQGSYLSVVKLLEEFRQFPKMIYVKSIDLTPQRMNGKGSVSARIMTYAIITPDQYKKQTASRDQAVGKPQGGVQRTQQATVAGGGE